MIAVFSVEFWIVVLFFITFFLAICLFVFVKKIHGLKLTEPDQTHGELVQVTAGHASGSAENIINLLEPLVQEAQNAAISFDQQIKEKKRIIKELNAALDSRIISLNLILSRATALYETFEQNHRRPVLNVSSNPVLDQQHQIIEMYHQKVDMDTIAQRLSIPKGEVRLVIDLKKKFMAMEKTIR